MKVKLSFAAMYPEEHRRNSALGGRAAHAKGRAHTFTSEEARIAGAKGGQAVARDRDHMSRIGRVGGAAVSRNIAYMTEIGRRGGVAVAAKRAAFK